MPEFERNPYGWQDYHDDQLKHYGLKRETSPASSSRSGQASAQPNFRRNEATGMPVPASVPRRKPVPGASPPVTPRAQVPAPASPRTQSPEGTRLIYKGPDGRFDPSTIRMDRSRYTPPSSPIGPSSRPTSSTSSKPGLTRSDTGDSKSSWRLRKDSAGQTFRRLSNSLKEKAGIVAMDRNDRVRYVRDKHAASGVPETPTKSRQGRSGSVTKGEQLALKISKAVDPVQALGRRGTDDSDMSMGFTDTAPAGMMEPCVRCNRPILDFAKQGLCQQCCKETKGKKKAGDGDVGVVEPHPDSPDDGYMKLPTKRKILRVRQTMYMDPGNPFDDDTPQIEQSRREQAARPPLVPPLPHADEVQLHQGPLIRSPRISEQAAVVASPLRAELVGDPDPRSLKRRSKSMALPLREPRNDHDYIAPRSLWQRRNASNSRKEQSKRAENDRDTKFYGFYDDIMPEYRDGDDRI